METDIDNLEDLNSWLEVNADALRNNAVALKAHLQRHSAIPPVLMAVVKADGYGHGAVRSAQSFIAGGATWLAVTTLSEAKELVAGGIDFDVAPTLVFSPMSSVAQAASAVAIGAQVTVCDSEHVRVVSTAAREMGKIANVQLKVDTGMSRFGLSPADALVVAEEIRSNPGLTLTGVYTHFPTANEKHLSRTRNQLQMFVDFCDQLAAHGHDAVLRHCGNSAALLRLPESRLDIVRAGTILYGQISSPFQPKVERLRSDTWELKSRVVFVHNLPAGVSVGYGAEAVTKRPTRAAILAIGYADGVTMQPASVTQGFRGARSLAKSLVSPKATEVKFGGFYAPVLGRIAMQTMVVDVTDSPKAIEMGDVAVVPARRLAVSARIPKISIGDSRE